VIRFGRAGWGAPEVKAFCARGDVRALYEKLQRQQQPASRVFVAEYRLDYLIHRYPKPYIALIDGLVMGGGVGISQGALLAVVGDKTIKATTRVGIRRGLKMSPKKGSRRSSAIPGAERDIR
jgi:enoyl-CoA hydratase/carnithine racemase